MPPHLRRRLARGCPAARVSPRHPAGLFQLQQTKFEIVKSSKTRERELRTSGRGLAGGVEQPVLVECIEKSSFRERSGDHSSVISVDVVCTLRHESTTQHQSMPATDNDEELLVPLERMLVSSAPNLWSAARTANSGRVSVMAVSSVHADCLRSGEASRPWRCRALRVATSDRVCVTVMVSSDAGGQRQS